MRAALLVGINHYENGSDLYGCVNDAHSVKSSLERHSDGSVNFDCQLLAASNGASSVTRRDLLDNLKSLFSADLEIALFYFAGHGHVEPIGGYLLTSESKNGDEGLSLNDVLTLINDSPAKNRIVRRCCTQVLLT